MRLGLLVAILVSLSSNAMASENIRVVEKGELIVSTSRVSIKPSGWMNYLKKIVRIESVKTEAGDVIPL